jgi:hypothetical protein
MHCISEHAPATAQAVAHTWSANNAPPPAPPAVAAAAPLLLEPLSTLSNEGCGSRRHTDSAADGSTTACKASSGTVVAPSATLPASSTGGPISPPCLDPDMLVSLGGEWVSPSELIFCVIETRRSICKMGGKPCLLC